MSIHPSNHPMPGHVLQCSWLQGLSWALFLGSDSQLLCSFSRHSIDNKSLATGVTLHDCCALRSNMFCDCLGGHNLPYRSVTLCKFTDHPLKAWPLFWCKLGKSLKDYWYRRHWHELFPETWPLLASQAYSLKIWWHIWETESPSSLRKAPSLLSLCKGLYTGQYGHRALLLKKKQAGGANNESENRC